jgi:hypothetical protein
MIAHAGLSIRRDRVPTPGHAELAPLCAGCQRQWNGKAVRMEFRVEHCSRIPLTSNWARNCRPHNISLS